MDDNQKDFLKEILNIGLGRAGNVLGQMTGSRIELAVPDVAVCESTHLTGQLAVYGTDDVYTVTQSFSGILSGDVILILTGFSGKFLTYRLCGEELNSDRLEEEIQATVTEVGNIITNHFIGSWSNMFVDQFQFGVPSFEKGSLPDLLNKYAHMPARQGSKSRAVVAQAHMDVPDFTLAASVAIMFTPDSLEHLIGSMSGAPEA